jgi:hypothetical protein
MHRLKLFSIAPALAAIALLSSAGLAANRGGDIAETARPDRSADANAGGERAMPVVELPAAASEVAVERAAEGLAIANAAITAATERATVRGIEKANENARVAPVPASGAKERPVVAGPPETLPGWRCGDPNREHSRPPGRPAAATPPPGCDR